MFPAPWKDLNKKKKILLTNTQSTLVSCKPTWSRVQTNSYYSSQSLQDIWSSFAQQHIFRDAENKFMFFFLHLVFGELNASGHKAGDSDDKSWLGFVIRVLEPRNAKGMGKKTVLCL